MLLGSARACGKLILLGEHFVVHGVPAVAVPVTAVGTTVRVLEDPQGRPAWLDSPFTGDVKVAGERLLDAALEALGVAPGMPWRVEVQSDVPVGAGLGSSAALSVALVRALSEAAGVDVSIDDVNAQAHALERLVHGTPSGIDDTVVTYARALAFRRSDALGDPTIRFLAPGRTLVLVLGAVPREGTTFDAVAAVHARKAADPARFARQCESVTHLVDSGIRAFESGFRRSLGELMDQNHGHLVEVGVSNAGLDRLCSAARAAGARGAKLTGAGRGGFMVALAERGKATEVAAALESAGATTVLTTEVT